MFYRRKHDNGNRQLIQLVWDRLSEEKGQSSSLSKKRLQAYRDGLSQAVTTVLYNRSTYFVTKYPLTLPLRKELQQWADKAIKDWQGDLQLFETIRDTVAKGYPESYPGGPKVARVDCLMDLRERRRGA